MCSVEGVGPWEEGSRAAFWDALDRIDSLEDWMDGEFETNIREYTFAKSEMAFRQKTLRFVVRYQFVQATEGTPSHYLVIIDGMVLDARKQSGKTVSFLRHLQWLRIQLLDRKPGGDVQTLEWSEATFPEGSSASTVVARVYGERACPVRVSFALNEDHVSVAKYDLPEAMKRLLGLPPVLSVDETCLGVMGYAHNQGLFSKDRKYIRCDDAFREIFGIADVMGLPTLRQRIVSQLTGPHSPPSIASFEMTMSPNPMEDVNVPLLQALTPVAAPSSSSSNGIYAGQGGKTLKDIIARMGGKVFDMAFQERDDMAAMASLQEMQAIHVDSYDHAKRRRISSLFAMQAGKEATADAALANTLGDLVTRVRKGQLADQPAVDGKIETSGVIINRADRHYLVLLPPLPAELIAARTQKISPTDPVRSLPSALHAHGAFRSASSIALDSRNPSLQAVVASEDTYALFNHVGQQLWMTQAAVVKEEKK